VTRVAGSLLIGMVQGYQLLLSPLLPPSCRFYPSCSAYAVDALRRHGPLAGVWLTAVRLLKCHPFHPGGVDLVPEHMRRKPASQSSSWERGKQPL
jgi:hypothetical protein